MLRAFLAKFQNFPESWKQPLGDRPMHIVLGNETGDLDSVVCSITLAHYLTLSTPAQYIPLMAFNRSELALRTEVLYVLKRAGLDPQHLIFRDEIHKWEHWVVSVTLVDHSSIHLPGLLSLSLYTIYNAILING